MRSRLEAAEDGLECRGVLRVSEQNATARTSIETVDNGVMIDDTGVDGSAAYGHERFSCLRPGNPDRP